MLQRGFRRGLLNLAVAAVALVWIATPTTTIAQTQASTVDPPLLPNGRPDLSGVWDYRSLTPLERPSELADQAFFTDEEAAAFATRRAQESDVDQNLASPLARRVVARSGLAQTKERLDLAGGYNNFWYDWGTTGVETKRTSLVIDPPDGRIPDLSPAARERAARRLELLRRVAEGPEDRNLGERCIVRPNAGPPLTPGGYNNNVQLFQTPDHLVILTEQFHDARIVPLDGRPHLRATLRQWMGDSRGYWEGDTLVVETTNFNDEKDFRGGGGGMHLLERFTRVDADTLLYEFRVSDPESFASPWTAQIPMKENSFPIYEYACHEGNYGISGTLSGARAIERTPAR